MPLVYEDTSLNHKKNCRNKESYELLKKGLNNNIENTFLKNDKSIIEISIDNFEKELIEEGFL